MTPPRPRRATSSGPRCGNNPRAQLSDADRQAVAEFRAYLDARAEKRRTITDQVRPIENVPDPEELL
ncbi:hypothetical protein ACFUO0_17585 [Streptomyces cinereoruber]|uniref:hypothetical protein n=1 Tax=Streptomyces cinereoruber TaxID=67260 RepID=UPI0036284A73